MKEPSSRSTMRTRFVKPGQGPSKQANWLYFNEHSWLKQLSKIPQERLVPLFDSIKKALLLGVIDKREARSYVTVLFSCDGIDTYNMIHHLEMETERYENNTKEPEVWFLLETEKYVRDGEHCIIVKQGYDIGLIPEASRVLFRIVDGRVKLLCKNSKHMIEIIENLQQRKDKTKTKIRCVRGLLIHSVDF